MACRFRALAALGILAAIVVGTADAAAAATGGKPSKPATCAAPSAPAPAAPKPGPSPVPAPLPVPDPAAGASPAPTYPKPGTLGNCAPHAANLPAPVQIPPASPPGGVGVSWFDIPGQIEKAINTWIGDLAQAALTPIIGLFAAAMLTEPELSSGRIAQLWQADAVLADSFYVLYVLAGGLLLMGYGTLQTRWTSRQIIPRLVVGMIASNLSLPILQQAVDFTGALADALWSQPVNAAGLGDQVIAALLSSIVLPDGVTQVAFGVFALVICVLALAVLATCAARIGGLMVLTALAPLMLATHALPGVDAVARLWWRATVAVLATQILQTLVFILMIQVICDPGADLVILPTGSGLTDFVVGSSLLVIMLKVPGWMNRMVFGSSPRTLVGSILRTAAVTAIGFKLGVPGAFSARAITGRLVARRIGGRGGSPGTLPARPPAPRGPGGRGSASFVSSHTAAPPTASTNPPGSTSPTGLAPLGARGAKPRPGSHPSGQLALWRVRPGQPVPQPWWGLPPAEPSPPPVPAEIPGQLQLPGFHRPAPAHSDPWPTAFRRAPLFPVPQARHVAPVAVPLAPTAPEPAPARPSAPRPGQGELFTIRQARALTPKKPPRPKQAQKPWLAVTFQPPVFRDDESE